MLASVKPTAESVSEGIDLTGKTAFVTGATSGLGREAARVLALRGARVIFPCRSELKGREVVAEIARLLPEAASRCEVHACDLASLRTVRGLLDRLENEERTIDLLMMNAGVFNLPYRLTEDGLEATYASNYGGHFMLLHGLLTRGLLARDARVVATLSEAVRLNPFLRADIPMLVDPEAHAGRFSRRSASPEAKVLTTLALQRFSRVAPGTRYANVAFHGCDPGPTLTDNINQVGPVLGFLARATSSILFQPVEQGAALLVWVATSPAGGLPSGRLFTRRLEEAPMPKRWTDPRVAEDAWRATEAKLGLPAFP
jgi:WW domain-containing oxidoreductase